MFRIKSNNTLAVVILTFLLASCANGPKDTFFRPNFSSIEWAKLEVYYVVKTSGGDKLDKVTISDRQELRKGYEFLRGARVTSYPYPLICLNRSTTNDGMAWEFDFVFENRIDFVLSSERSKSYSVFSKNSDFFEWIHGKCWDNARANHPRVFRSQIKLRAGDLISVPGVREMYVP
jgi:hypothetical protein